MTSYRPLSLVWGPMLLVSVAYCATVSEEPDPIPADWAVPELISNLEESFRSHVAMDPNGNAVAVWDEDKKRDIHEDIWSARYTPSGEWSAPEHIGGGSESAATYGRVAMDAAGNAVVVWHESDETKTFSIWSNRYQATSGWGDATPIEDDIGDAQFPQVAMNAEGNAVAVWHQDDGMSENIWSNHYTPSTGRWGDVAMRIDTSSGGSALHPQVAIDAEGNAVAVWHEHDGTRFNIRSNRYRSTAGWGDRAGLIETVNAGDAEFPQVAMDAEGNAVAVWHQFDGKRDNIWSNRYEIADGWGTAEPIGADDAGDGRFPQVAVNAEGTAVVVWELSHGTSVDIWSNRYTPGAGWWSPERIERKEGGSLQPKVAVDSEGNAVAVWTQYEGTSDQDNDSVWSNHYDAATAQWGVAQAIDNYDDGNAWTPQVAMDPNGKAIAVWAQGEAVTGQIWSSRLERP